MSKTQERDSNLFSDLANTTIAGELESRLRELERNIAVARQFIKLADETYTQVRREWEILQEGVRSRKTETTTSSYSRNSEKHDLDTIEETKTPRTTKTHNSRETNTKASASPWKTHTNPRTSKTNTPTKEDTDASSQDGFSTNTPKTPHGQGTKHKNQKTSKEKL
jgi:hypothetical protein